MGLTGLIRWPLYIRVEPRLGGLVVLPHKRTPAGWEGRFVPYTLAKYQGGAGCLLVKEDGSPARVDGRSVVLSTMHSTRATETMLRSLSRWWRQQGAAGTFDVAVQTGLSRWEKRFFAVPIAVMAGLFIVAALASSGYWQWLFQGAPLPAFSWWNMVPMLVWLGMGATMTLTCWAVFAHMLVGEQRYRLDGRGLHVPDRGGRFWAWTELREIGKKGAGARLVFAGGEVVLAPDTRMRAVLRGIRERFVPDHAERDRRETRRMTVRLGWILGIGAVVAVALVLLVMPLTGATPGQTWAMAARVPLAVLFLAAAMGLRVKGEAVLKRWLARWEAGGKRREGQRERLRAGRVQITRLRDVHAGFKRSEQS